MDILERIYKSITSEQTHHKGIHVSSLAYDCLRRAYYSQLYGEGLFNLKSLISFWIGRQVHKTPFLKHHELSVDWEGIFGTCDDYENGILLDKKTCTSIPRFPNNHHARQVEYYALMLSKQGKKVRKAFIVYIDLCLKDIKPFSIKLRSFPEIERELLSKRDRLKDALNTKTPPPRKIGWLCNYCVFASKCFGAENVNP